MTVFIPSTGKILQFPDFCQEIDDAPEEKRLEIIPRKIAEFFAILATLSVAVKKGSILAVERGPAGWLRCGLSVARTVG